MRETPWERLYRLVEERRAHLNLTLAGIDQVGGPSPKWVQKLRTQEGPPSDRSRRSMLDLDRALNWPEGTSWSLVAEDRSNWSDILLEDEERQLLEATDEEANFAFVVAARLRALPAAQRDDAMRAILAVLGVTA